MIKIISILLAVLTATFLPLTWALQGKSGNPGKPDKCIVFYERSAALVIGNYNFTGSNTGTDIQSFNTPFFYSLSRAESATAFPDGRVVGFYSLATTSGTWSFEFFATNSWITAVFGFGANGAPNVVTGGSGCSIDEGTLTSSIVPNTGPLFILQWSICPESKPDHCPPKH